MLNCLFSETRLLAFSIWKQPNPTADKNEERVGKLAGAVHIIFECIGEDPEREGLCETPEIR